MKNKKSTVRLILPVVILCAVIAIAVLFYIFNGSGRESMEWAKHLSAEQVESMELVIFPQDAGKQYKALDEEEREAAAALIRESRGRYVGDPEELCGGGISLYVHMKDGSEHIVINDGNVYLRIDGDSYDAGYGWLSSWPYREGDSPLPDGFYGTGTPESYVTFQATVIEIGESGMLVEPVPDSPELDSADRFSIPAKNMPPSPEAQVGNVIEIQYDGEILETYPAQLGRIYGTAAIR